MRYQWRLLLLRNGLRSQLHISGNAFHRRSQEIPKSLNPLRSLSTLFQTAPVNTVSIPKPLGSMICNFSSEPEVDEKRDVLIDIFSKFTDGNAIRKELETNNVVINRDLILKALRGLESNPDVARRFFNWVLENDGGKLCSRGYNSMLKILGLNGCVEEFWGLADSMKKTKGYGISKYVRDKVLEKLKNEGLKDDVEKLTAVFDSGSTDTSEEKTCTRISRIIRKEVWGDEVEQKIKDLNLNFSSNSVKMVLEKLDSEPNKALIFFRWLEESGLLKHNESTYNAMVRVLGKEDCIDRFWKVADEMRNAGYEMEEETYCKVSESFYKRNMIRDAVYLYEFAMAGENEPSPVSCTSLLRKVGVGKNLDMSLFSRVLKAYKGKGHVLRFSILDAVLKALAGVGRLAEYDKILEAMKEVGFVADGSAPRVAYRLSSSRKLDGASEFMDILEAAGSLSDRRTLESFVEGHCVSGDLKNATKCLQKMIEKLGINSVGYAFEVLVGTYCRQNRASDAFKLLCELVNEKELEPRHSTYKLIISKLLVQGGFKDALTLLGLMKTHGFPPYLEPFIEHVSRSGTADDAVAFLHAGSSKFPSRQVFLRVFEAFFMTSRHSEAQDLLSKCPASVRNHADVLNLFCSMKSTGAASSALAA